MSNLSLSDVQKERILLEIAKKSGLSERYTIRVYHCECGDDSVLTIHRKDGFNQVGLTYMLFSSGIFVFHTPDDVRLDIKDPEFFNKTTSLLKNF